MVTFWACVSICVVPFVLCSVYFILAQLGALEKD